MFGVDDAALAILAAGAIGTAGQLYANSKNIGATKSVNEANLAMAALNNATQIDMANTAHQREVLDLRKAGLNPILSAGGNGASTPTLQSARLDAAQVENPVQALGQSAQSLARYMSDDYKAGVADRQAQADYDATMAKQARAELRANQSQSIYDAKMADIRRKALDEMTREHYLDRSGKYPVVRERANYDKVLNLVKEGIEADLKDKTNINWRHNLDSISRGVNSATGLMRLGK